jgi:hypothetical protein
MSAEQIIAKIERLPQAEQEAVLAFLEKRLGDAGTAGESVSPAFGNSPARCLRRMPNCSGSWRNE